MPALDEQIVRHLTEHGPMIESAVAALACSDPKYVNAALLRLRSSKRVIQDHGVHWRVTSADDTAGRSQPPLEPKTVAEKVAAMRTVPSPVEALPEPETKAEEEVVAIKSKCSKCGGKDPRPNGYCRSCNQEYARARYQAKKLAATTPSKSRGKPKPVSKEPTVEAVQPKNDVQAALGRLKARAQEHAVLIQPRMLDLVLKDEITGDEHRISLGIATAKALGAQLAAL